VEPDGDLLHVNWESRASSRGAAVRPGSGLALPEEATPAIFAQNTYEFRDTLEQGWGAHAFKAGVEDRREQNNNNLAGGARPDYSFSGLCSTW